MLIKNIFIVAYFLFLLSDGNLSKIHKENQPADPTVRITYRNKDYHEIVLPEFDAKAFEGKKPKNIIFFIADGMGLAHFHAAKIANKGNLYLSHFPVTGLITTHSYDEFVTDSGAGGTAFSTGKKTRNGYIGIDHRGRRIPTILQLASASGFATGLVATSKITHATPAAFISHQRSRLYYEEIAADFLKTDIDVFIGGGNQEFIHRRDKRNLLEELEAKEYQIITELSDLRNAKGPKLAALVHHEHLPKIEYGRDNFLPDATEKALEILSQNEKGFFVMIEGSQVDWGGHDNNIRYIIDEMLDFDRAVGKAMEFAAKRDDTLILVTADHETGALSILGGDYKRGQVVVSFSTPGHSGIMVPSFAFGAGSSKFSGIYDNTDVFYKFKELLGLP
ncbi:MAG: alkaline phosphatase [Cyclobacteriaceae bacterium]|nr:alkaline phosphatase [Cyclobacteriaceae bacterium]